MSQSQVRQRFREPRQQKVYADYMTTDRDPLLPGTDGLTSAFFRGFLEPKRIVHDRKSLAYAAWSAGRDRRRRCEIIAKRAGMQVFDVPEDCTYFWKTPGADLDAPGYRESHHVFHTDAAAWQDAAFAAQATTRNPEVVPHDIQKAIDRLRSLIVPGKTIYTVRRHENRTGAKHEISLLIARNDKGRAMIDDITRTAAIALSATVGDYRGIVTYNVGADMGAQLVHRLGHALYPDSRKRGDGYNSLVQEWL